jgi:methanogenic corrinoid protein MtbC1
MKELLTPKQVARAIQASESSVKRWCDKGVIPTQYTAGGHRRIPMSGLLDFLRSSKHRLVRPEVLGLPATTGHTVRVVERAAGQLTEALVQGDEEQTRQIVFDLYLAEHSISAICDQVIARSFQEIGDRWECGEAEVYQERRSCEQALRVLHELRIVIPAPPAEAPLAIGGAIEGDQYNLATTMVELVLRDAQWNATSLGDNLPFDTLSAAIKQHRPSMFWISVSHLADESQFIDAYTKLYDEFGLDVAFAVGGRALTEEIRQQMKYAAFCDNLQHLESFAQTLRGATEN